MNENDPQITRIDADLRAKKGPRITPVRFSEPTPGESSFGGPLSGIQRGTAGQARIEEKKENDPQIMIYILQ